jgi:hypothetical protein
VREKISTAVALLRENRYVTDWACWLDDYERWLLDTGGTTVPAPANIGVKTAETSAIRIS